MKYYLALCATLLLILARGCDLSTPSRVGEVTESWETTNKTFAVRVERRKEETAGYVAGAYYVFMASHAGSAKWEEFMTVHHDDPDPIPRDQVRFVGDKIGYAFMNYNYAVTTDGGNTWSIWYIVKDLPDWQSSRAVIKEVRIEPDGTGTMTLTPFASQSVPELNTKDFGRHWSVE